MDNGGRLGDAKCQPRTLDPKRELRGAGGWLGSTGTDAERWSASPQIATLWGLAASSWQLAPSHPREKTAQTIGVSMANSSKAPQRKPNRGYDEEDLFRIAAEILGVDEQRLREDPSLLDDLDSLDLAELVMELDDEFKWH
jgi:hypothetical protein